MFDQYLAHPLAKERMEDAMRQVQQVRLIRAVRGPKKGRARPRPVALILGSLLALFTPPGVGEHDSRDPFIIHSE